MIYALDTNIISWGNENVLDSFEREIKSDSLMAKSSGL